MNRRNHAISLQQAAQDSPTFAHLAGLAAESLSRLQVVQTIVPAALHCTMKPGPINEGEWCLIIDNNAAAAKIRQLVPAMEAHLRNKGFSVQSIRLKVQIPQNKMR